MTVPCTRIGLAALTVLCILQPCASANAKPRTVTGRVLTSDGETVKGAVVQIKDTRSLHIRSFISQDDGGYHFAGLNPDVDYEIFARYRQRTSPTKTVSQFRSAEVVQLDLVIGSEPRP